MKNWKNLCKVVTSGIFTMEEKGCGCYTIRKDLPGHLKFFCVVCTDHLPRPCTNCNGYIAEDNSGKYQHYADDGIDFCKNPTPSENTINIPHFDGNVIRSMIKSIINEYDCSEKEFVLNKAYEKCTNLFHILGELEKAVINYFVKDELGLLPTKKLEWI